MLLNDCFNKTKVASKKNTDHKRSLAALAINELSLRSRLWYCYCT